MFPHEWLSMLAASVSERQRKLYILVSAALFLLIMFALPLTLMGAEDDVDGLSGFIALFFGAVFVAAVIYGALMMGLYKLFPNGQRPILILVLFSCLLSAIIFGFGYQADAGMLDKFLFSEADKLQPNLASFAIDLFLIGVAVVMAVWGLTRKPNWVENSVAVFLVAVIGLGVLNAYSLNERISRKSDQGGSGNEVYFNYSKTGKNVLLMMLDGGMSGYIPDILKDEPELEAKLAGFTWYSNIISTGNRTINGTPSLFGGFDYTVSAINARQGGDLTEKTSAAYKVYVDNFSEHGFDVLYSDPFWFGFERKGDCELFNGIYEKEDKGKCLHTIGKQVSREKAQIREGNERNLHKGFLKQYLALSIYKIAPSSLKSSIYGDGEWLGLSHAWKKKEDKYLNNYLSLFHMGRFSNATNTKNTFTFITNELPRAPSFVGQNCIPDNALNEDSAHINPLMKRYGDQDTVKIYMTTRCTLRALGEYLDWFKHTGIYDNTMIAITSDHGWKSNNPLLSHLSKTELYSMFQSFLLFKDFGKGQEVLPLVESQEFIANANVPGMLCMSIGGCVDRATGKKIYEKPLRGEILLHETPWQPLGQMKDAYVVEALYSVKDDITKESNWKIIKARK